MLYTLYIYFQISYSIIFNNFITPSVYKFFCTLLKCLCVP